LSFRFFCDIQIEETTIELNCVIDCLNGCKKFLSPCLFISQQCA
jgi:hypothetical protein